MHRNDGRAAQRRGGYVEGGNVNIIDRRIAGFIAVAACGLAAGAAEAQQFSAGTVTITVGFPPGGGYDIYARVLGRHIGRHLPGKPNVVVQNQPGAGSLTAANAIANTAPKDGSHLALFASSTALEPVLGNPQAKFDTVKLTWVGNMMRETTSCGVWHTSGIKTWEDAVKKGAKFGASGPAAITAQHAIFMKNVLGVPFGVVFGYGGTAQVNLAMQRGEVDGSCGLYVSSVRGAYRDDYAAGRIAIIVQFGKEDEPFFKGAPNIYKLIKSEEDRLVTDFIFEQTEITRPVAAPPGLSPAIVETLRTAFDATMKDAQFLADAKKAQVDIVPMTGAETAAAFARFAATPKAVIDRANQAVVAK